MEMININNLKSHHFSSDHLISRLLTHHF